MVAAAAKAVVAPDLAHVEPDFQPVGEAVEIARDVARRRVIFAAEAADLLREILAALPPRPFGEDAHVGRIAYAIRSAAVADDVIVEVGDDVPALRLGISGDHLGAV